MSLLATMARTYGKDRASREKLERIRRKRLRALVDYARRNSPFYGELYGGLGADWTLGDLPPVTKPELMARFDDVVTDRAVTMARVLETFFESKGLQVAVLPSKTPPSPDPVSGKFKHVYRAKD